LYKDELPQHQQHLLQETRRTDQIRSDQIRSADLAKDGCWLARCVWEVCWSGLCSTRGVSLTGVFCLQVSEQVDSLRVLFTDPVDYLVTPRVLASMIAGPILNVLCFCMGERWWQGATPAAAGKAVCSLASMAQVNKLNRQLVCAAAADPWLLVCLLMFVRAAVLAAVLPPRIDLQTLQ